MHVTLTTAMIGNGPVHRTRGPVDAAAPGNTRQAPPVERVIEGELLGRGRGSASAGTGPFDTRAGVHAAGSGDGTGSDPRLRAALAVYAGIAAVGDDRRRGAGLDLYV